MTMPLGGPSANGLWREQWQKKLASQKAILARACEQLYTRNGYSRGGSRGGMRGAVAPPRQVEYDVMRV